MLSKKLGGGGVGERADESEGEERAGGRVAVWDDGSFVGRCAQFDDIEEQLNGKPDAGLLVANGCGSRSKRRRTGIELMGTHYAG